MSDDNFLTDQTAPPPIPRSSHTILVVVLIVLLVTGIGIAASFYELSQRSQTEQIATDQSVGLTEENIVTVIDENNEPVDLSQPTIDPLLDESLIQPANLIYKGAFRLPAPSGGSGWGYGGYAATYYPGGDPNGSADGYPGSLFAVGHVYQQMVSEISIPSPVISKQIDDLEVAQTLQPFADIRDSLFGAQEIPRAALAYLPPQGAQTSGKLYFSWGQHFEDGSPTHGWSELTLADPRPAGAWYIDGYTSYATNDYMFELPSVWANTYVSGRLLATGRFRDGNWSGRGPALFAIAPWENGNPPASNTKIPATPLLLYGIQEPNNPEIVNDPSMQMKGFSEADEWSGAGWLTLGDKSGLIFIGTKGIGNTWYGFANGVVYPTSGDENDVYPDVPDFPYDQRGWWSQGIEAQIIFYNPHDIEQVAQGIMQPSEPQPYATLNIDKYLIDPGFDLPRGKRYLVGAPAYDREHGLLYIFELMADGEDEQSIVHVFELQ